MADTRSRTLTTVSDDSTYTNLTGAKRFDTGLANFDRPHYFSATFLWDLPKAAKFVGGNGFAKAILDNWILSGFTSVASGNPTELGLGITGQDAGNRLLGTYTAGALSGQSPRFLVNGSPQDGGTINRAAFSVPGVGQNGPYPRLTSAIRGFAIRTSRFSRTYRSAARASATFSFALRRLTF